MKAFYKTLKKQLLHISRAGPAETHQKQDMTLTSVMMTTLTSCDRVSNDSACVTSPLSCSSPQTKMGFTCFMHEL